MKIKSLLILLSLIALSLAGNVFSLQLFMGFNFLFGSIGVLLVLRMYGIFWGVIAAVIASSWTIVLFGHPYAMIWLTGEAVFIGLMLTRKKSQNIVLLNTIYWPLLGNPALFLIFQFVMKVNMTGTVAAMLMFWIIGITNSVTATLLMNNTALMKFFGIQDRMPPVKMRSQIFNMLIGIVLYPAIFIMVINGRETMSSNRNEIINNLDYISKTVTREIDDDIHKYLKPLAVLSDTISSSGINSSDEINRNIKFIKDSFPELNKIIIMNADYKSQDLIQHHNLCIKSMKETMLPYFSKIITIDKSGRSFITFGVPVIKNNSIYAFILAEIDINYFNTHLNSIYGGRINQLFTITDNSGKIIATTNKDFKINSDYNPMAAGDPLIADKEKNIINIIPFTQKPIPLWQRYQRSTFIKQNKINPDSSWTLSSETKFFPYQKILLEKQSGSLSVILLLILFSLGAAYVLSKRFSMPISYLTRATTNFPEKIYTGEKVELPHSSIIELSQLILNFNELSAALSEKFQQIKNSHDILEQKVTDRTNELIKANADLKKEIDIRLKAEKEKNLLYTAIEQEDESLLITEPDGRIIYVNPAFEKTTGYRKEEVIGKNPSILKSGKQDEIFYKEMWQILLSGNVWKGRIINMRKDGSLYTENTCISPITDDHGTIINFVATNMDITKEAILELQLRESQKMEAIGLLAGGIAHDFNNMLSAIMGYASLLKMNSNGNQAIEDYSANLIDVTERATILTRQLLLFSRKNTSETKVINLNESITSIQKMLKRLISEDIELEFDACCSELLIKADPGQIDQVMINMITNAKDAMPNGGRITIKTETATLDSDFAEMHGYGYEGKFVLLIISDSGEGMDEQIRQQIFEPFFTTKKRGKGTGLGLSVVYGIIKQHNGFISVYSENNKGTTFKIYFPLEENDKKSEILKMNSNIKGGNETILISEDDPHLRDLTQKILEQNGYRVISSENGFEAIEKFRLNKDIIDIGIFDVIMPVMNGKEAADRIREIKHGFKIIFTSGYTDDILKIESLDQGYNRFLSKPLIPNQMLQSIRELLDA